jgi:hypothetical protein
MHQEHQASLMQQDHKQTHWSKPCKGGSTMQTPDMYMRKAVQQNTSITTTESYPHDPGLAGIWYNMAAFLRHFGFRGADYQDKYYLPNDVIEKGVNLSAKQRVAEMQRQYAMDWNNHFMSAANTVDRLNPVGGVTTMAKQKQLTVPNVYSQFYAMMLAMKSSFGSLNPNG